MKILYLISILLSLLLLNSCGSGPTEHSALDEKTSASDSVYNVCYASFIQQDTVLLNALVYGDSIKGSLGYKLYEKQQNNGLILGKMHGDTLRALYTFMKGDSELINEITFLKKDSVLTEGLGTRTIKDGKLVFENNQNIKYTGLRLAKTKCK